jgi:hypothetical protein
MAVVIGGILGGMALGSSLLGGLGARSQAQAQAMQQQLVAQNANFQRQWQVNANNRNIEKANLTKAINNKKIEQVAITDRAIQEVYTKLGYDNAKGQFSKQTNQVNSALLSSVSGRNISSSSGTARALLRQNLQNATANMANLRINKMNKMRDIETTYQNRLAQRDFNYSEFQTFMPGYAGMVEQGSIGNVLAVAGLNGLQAGITGALLYGQGSGGGGGVESYTTPGGSNFVGPIIG